MKKAKRNIIRAKIIAVRALNDYIYYLTDKRRIVLSNLLAGVMRGIGGAIGFWLLSTLLILIFGFLADQGVPLLDAIIKYFANTLEKYK